MRRSEWLVRAVLAFCLVYGVVAVADRGREVFPAFAWDLFAKVPAAHGRDYTVRITEATGLKVAVPVFYENSRLQGGAREVQGVYALQQLGRTLARGQRARADVLRKRFEAIYFAGHPRVRYEVVERTYDIRARVDCRECFTRIRVLAGYAKG